LELEGVPASKAAYIGEAAGLSRHQANYFTRLFWWVLQIYFFMVVICLDEFQ